MKILVIGQCTLHWGRMEYGNIGNYYIVEPFFRELHRVFPDAEILTSMQMSDAFCTRENIVRLPMEIYYGWTGADLEDTERELDFALTYAQSGALPETTPYIDTVLDADLVVDFSGDIWGDNADFLGPDRFRVGVMKNKIVKLLGKPLAMIAGSPGPFEAGENLALAREVFSDFDLITHREAVSKPLLDDYGLSNARQHSLACPAFLFEPAQQSVVAETTGKLRALSGARPLVGFIVCGWNMELGPFDKWPRDDAEYQKFLTVVEHIVDGLGADVVLMSHSNGFHLPPNFELIRGRDFPIAEQLFNQVKDSALVSHVHLLDEILLPAETKAVIGSLDMLVSGRIHAAVAGLSQHVPTVILDYGHEPKAHKLRGFAGVAGVPEYVADPANASDMINRIDQCWSNRRVIRGFLEARIPEVQALARQNFELLHPLVSIK